MDGLCYLFIGMPRPRLRAPYAALIASTVAVGFYLAPKVFDFESAGRQQETGGGGAPAESPTPITPGAYQPPAYANRDVAAQGRRAEAADLAKPQFTGWVNGIYIYSDRTAPPPLDPAVGAACANDQLRQASEDEVRASPHFFSPPSYLPPGTFESRSPSGTACGDRIIAIERQFELQPHGSLIGIVRRVDLWAVSFRTSQDRIQAATINGKPAVTIKPVTAEGYGNSAILIREEYGVTQVGAWGLPLEELVKVAQALHS